MIVPIESQSVVQVDIVPLIHQCGALMELVSCTSVLTKPC